MSGPSPVTRLAVEVGSLLTKIAVAGPPGAEPWLRTEAAASGRERAALTTALEAVRRSPAVPPGAGAAPEVSLVVPDAWLDGSAEGAQRQEALRHVAEDQLGLTHVSWAGQLASVAALAASRRGFAEPGRYLVCDVGGSGVRTALFEVTGRTVRPVIVYDAPGGGWLDFDEAIRATLRAASDPGLATWYRSAAEQDRRARLVFGQARNGPEFLDAPVYSLTGLAGHYELTAAQAVGCFAATAERIRAGAAAVLGGALGVKPAVAVLTGALAWFPPAQQTAAEAAGIAPDVLVPEAAVLGALLLAGGQAQLGPHGLPPVSLPAHRITDGLLEEASLPLPWTDSFSPAGGGLLVLEDPELTLDIGSQRVTLRVPGLVPGPYLIGVRPSWSGTGVVVLRAPRPASADREALDQAVPGLDVHVLPLDLQETPR